MHLPPLTFVTGKGGTGKSIITAALALNAARSGQRTLVCELDDHPTMTRLFGLPDDLGVEPTATRDGVHVANFRGMPVMQAFLRTFVPSRRVTDLLLRNRVATTFFESAPGVMDAVALDRVADILADGRWDRVFVDLPATGHALTLLRLPASMAEMIGVGDLAARVRRLADIMADPARAALVVVTLPEEMPVTETLEFCSTVRREVEIRLGAIVVNALRRLPLDDDERSRIDRIARATEEAQPQASARIRLALRLGNFWHDEDQRGLLRLEEELPSTERVTVPFVYHKESERDLVEQIAASLRQREQEGGAP